VIVARVRRTIHERALGLGGQRVLVACSGGPDSAALLHALHRLAPELGMTLYAASVDHGLRADAWRDVEVAAELARMLGVPFAPLRVEIPSEGASVLAKARRARYAALLSHAASLGAPFVAVGHTQDDQAETVLLRSLRGSGVAGLSGVEPRRGDGVVRPLLDCSRAEVHTHVAHHALPFVRDPSNDEPRFARVRVRRELVPAALREDPRALVHLAQLADDAREIRGWLDASGAALLERAASGPEDLEAAVLLAAPRPVRSAALGSWVRAITGRSASRAHLIGLERTLQGSGEALLPGGRVARLDGALLRAGPPACGSR
jgi:tRNA(Ile)-lysidine synthase